MTILSGLANRTASIEHNDVDARGITLVRTAFVDTIGVALAGTQTEGFTIARDVLGVMEAAGPSLVLGTRHRGPVLDTAEVNAIAAHALDYDDSNVIVVGHPSAVLVPALLALGEATDATVGDLVVGYAAGYEAMLHIARGINPAHYERGWHPTTTTGVFGVAAAAARLLGLTPERTAVALAVAASTAAGIKANFGTMTKALHVGQAVRNGLLAAQLAGAGHTANPAAMEAPQGFLAVYNAPGEVDASAITAGLDGALELNTGFNPVKAFPCCGSTHSPVLAALDVRREVPDVSEIDRVQVIVDAKRLPHTDRPVLDEALAGKFSLQYVVARALLDGRFGLDHFEGNAHREPRVLALMERIDAMGAPHGGRNSFAAEVHVIDTAGSIHSARASERRLAVVPGAQIWAKFRDTATRALPIGQVEALEASLAAFDPTTRARDIAAALEASPA